MVDAMGGGNSLGTAQGRIVIDVTAVEQAAQLIKQATTQINASFLSINQSARTAAQGIGQVATSIRDVNATARSTSSAVSSLSGAMKGVASSAASVNSAINQVSTSATKVGRSVSSVTSQITQQNAVITRMMQGTSINSQNTVARGVTQIGRSAQDATQQVKNLAAQIDASFDPDILELNRRFGLSDDGASRVGIDPNRTLAGRALSRNTQIAGEASLTFRNQNLASTQKIDRAFARQSQQAAYREYNQISEAIKQVGVSAEQTGKSLQRLSGIIFPFSVAAGILSVVGIKTSNTIEQMNIRFRALEGSTEAAEARIAGLASEARKFNLPLTEVLAGIARLQPLLKQTGNETNRFVGLVARLAAVNPLQGAEGAALAIGEALSGTGNDFYSLQERFNIPRNLLRQAIAETSNFADALDLVLTRLGITEQVAMEFGQTFQGTFAAARDAVSRMLGEGFTPLLRAITPFIQKIADVATELNKVNSPIPTIIAGILAMTAAAAPLLFAIGKLAELWGKVSSNTRAAAIAQRGVRLAGAALAVAAGVKVGVAATSLASGESTASLESRLSEFIAQSWAMIAGTIEALFAKLQAPVDLVTSSFDALASVVRNAAGQLQESFGRFEEWLGQQVNNQNLIDSGRANINTGLDRQYTERILQSGDPVEQLVARLVQQFPERDTNDLYQTVQAFLNGDSGPLSDLVGIMDSQDQRLEGIANAMRTSFAAGGNQTDQLNAAFDYLGFGRGIQQAFSDALKRTQSSPIFELSNEFLAGFFQRAYDRFTGATGIGGASATPNAPVSTGNFGFNEDQINAFDKFKQQMADLESDYNDQILRENETYQKRRTDIIFEYNEKVVALQEEETRRRMEAQEDLAREIADVQEESAKEQLKAKRDLESEIAKILRESRIRVLEAAAQLDARAVFEEQRRTKARIGELNTEFDQEQAERKQQADQRIQDLQDEFKREEDKRAQDFQRRMAELDRQKNRELQQLYLQHNDTLREMANQYNRERNARNQAFAQELNDLAAQNGRVLNIHRQGMYQIENELLIWYNRMKQQFSGGTAPIIIAPAPFPGKPAPTPYQTGTNWVPNTSLYKLHEGEGVMTPEVNAVARKMLGGNYTQSQLAGLIAGGQQSSSSQSWDFSGMQVIVGDTGGRSDKQIAAMIEDGLYQFFTRASMQRKAMVA